ncbi:hypothetical protein GIB67_000995 [Kingdonia uniflora]|uniref:Late embryogenesis abundant protein LEA-2 subgroup domain-containing protein n=1 Tax=Kingdonia uniflora TaxID=39325 RepID=A0A7J7MG20_9MAGN|nr:hypothetical protein GIB67_000995 [Kingdonia uniflora]
MADQARPRIPATAGKNNYVRLNNSPTAKPIHEKPGPPPGTYIVQIPKDQIFCSPPPENANLYKKYTTRCKRSSRRWCYCIGWIFGIISVLIVLIAISKGVLHLVCQAKLPKYSVENISVNGFNLNDSNPTTGLLVSPHFDIFFKAENPHNKISIYYMKESFVTVSLSHTATFCKGALPVFWQRTKEVTIFQTALEEPGLHLSSTIAKTLTGQRKNGEIPLGLDLEVRVQMKIGLISTWTFTIKVYQARCFSSDHLYTIKEYNPGGCGGVARDHTEKFIDACASFIDNQTAFFAKVYGAIISIRLAKSLRAEYLWLELDFVA